MQKPSIDVEWRGPFAWPKIESALPPAPAVPGVYLLAAEHQNGYLIYAAGITRRSVYRRLREHTRHYEAGVYTALDIDALNSGIRKEVWHGFWTKARSAERLADYEIRRPEIDEAVRRQLAGFRIFVAELGTEPRILERLEAAIMSHLYKQPAPYCDIPDRGMMLAPRRHSEDPITLHFTCHHKLYAFPSELEI